MSALQRKTALERLAALQFTIDEEGTRHAFGKTGELADKFGLTIYDATYLELAVRRALPLATRDEALKKAAQKSGVKVL
jgi:predicted nucleic acid-binding protein